jgi:excisionase family DNA binding protein
MIHDASTVKRAMPALFLDRDRRSRRSWPSDGAVSHRVCTRVCGGRRGPSASRGRRWETGDILVSANGHLLTAGELAERWQVANGHVYRLTRDGLVPAVRLGRYYRCRRDAIKRGRPAASRSRAYRPKRRDAEDFMPSSAPLHTSPCPHALKEGKPRIGQNGGSVSAWRRSCWSSTASRRA